MSEFNQEKLDEIKDKKRAEFYLEFGRNVRTIRKDRQVSQTQLATELDRHRIWVCELETEGKNITLFDACRLAKVLRVSLLTLVGQGPKRKEK